jgi:hypothetical protein
MNTSASILHQPPLSHSQGIKEDAVVINNDIFTSIFNYLLKEDRDKIAQPNLIIGENGSGKTSLLKRMYFSIENSDKQLKPVFIEGKNLFSTDDIWKFCPLQDDSRRTVLLIDNIQYYFERTDNAEQYNLRGKLNKAGAPILIATSDKVLPAFTDYESAFFEGLKISYIRPLAIADYSMFVGNEADMARLENLMSYLPKTPRSVQIAAKIIEDSTSPETDIMLLIDYFFFYYQAKYDGYVVQIQRILSAIARAEDGVSLQEIRQMTGQDNGKISPYLKLMSDRKIIDKTSKTQRGGIYSIVDPLFRLWLQTNA